MNILILILYNIIQVYVVIVFIYVLLTWTPLINSRFGQMIGSVVNPYLNLFRGLLRIGMMDFGPIVGIILLQLAAGYLGTLI